MFRRIPTTILILLSGALIAIVPGCASRINLIKDSIYNIQTWNINGIKITNTRTDVDSRKFVVSGKLKRTHTSRSYPGHVDVAIISPDGNVFDQASVRNKLLFIGRSRRAYSLFKEQFPDIRPEGSTVRVGFHGKTSPEGEEFDCGANVAKAGDGSD